MQINLKGIETARIIISNTGQKHMIETFVLEPIVKTLSFTSKNIKT